MSEGIYPYTVFLLPGQFLAPCGPSLAMGIKQRPGPLFREVLFPFAGSLFWEPFLICTEKKTCHQDRSFFFILTYLFLLLFRFWWDFFPCIFQCKFKQWVYFPGIRLIFRSFFSLCNHISYDVELIPCSCC